MQLQHRIFNLNDEGKCLIEIIINDRPVCEFFANNFAEEHIRGRTAHKIQCSSAKVRVADKTDIK